MSISAVPVSAVTTPAPKPKGLTSIISESTSSAIPSAVAQPDFCTPIILRSLPKPMVMKLWYSMKIPSIMGRSTSVIPG